jgi:anti-anti-sigma factor
MTSAGSFVEGCEVRSTRVADHLRIELCGELDMSSAPDAKRALWQLVHEVPVTDVTVELQHLTFIDSSGLSVLIQLRAEVDHLGAAMRTTAATAAVRRTFEISGLTEHLHVED